MLWLDIVLISARLASGSGRFSRKREAAYSLEMRTKNRTGQPKRWRRGCRGRSDERFGGQYGSLGMLGFGNLGPRVAGGFQTLQCCGSWHGDGF